MLEHRTGPGQERSDPVQWMAHPAVGPPFHERLRRLDPPSGRPMPCGAWRIRWSPAPPNLPAGSRSRPAGGTADRQTSTARSTAPARAALRRRRSDRNRGGRASSGWAMQRLGARRSGQDKDRQPDHQVDLLRRLLATPWRADGTGLLCAEEPAEGLQRLDALAAVVVVGIDERERGFASRALSRGTHSSSSSSR